MCLPCMDVYVPVYIYGAHVCGYTNMFIHVQMVAHGLMSRIILKCHSPYSLGQGLSIKHWLTYMAGLSN